MSYILQNRLGNEDEFLEMLTRCTASGIRIYVDAVINHMATLDSEPIIGTAGSIATAWIQKIFIDRVQLSTITMLIWFEIVIYIICQISISQYPKYVKK